MIELDVLRGIAIILALGWHFNNLKTDIFILDILLLPGKIFGWAGVDLFFVLSGFLIGGMLFEEYKLTGYFKVKKFFVRRVFKIWPVLCIYLIFQIFIGVPWQSFLWQCLFHLQNYFIISLPHLWSLAVEEHFYIFLAILLYLFVIGNIPIRLFLYVLIGVLLIIPILRLIALDYFKMDTHYLHVYTHFRLDSLALGVLLAYLRVFYATIIIETPMLRLREKFFPRVVSAEKMTI